MYTFESIIRDNIIQPFITNKLFSTKQFGFIKGTTVTQLVEILYKLTDCMVSRGQIDVIYADREKSFDKVPISY